MSHSRFYPRPYCYMTGPGDPRGLDGATVAERTCFRYQLSGQSWGNPSLADPSRYNGRPYISQLLMIPAAGIPDGTLVTVADGYGQQDVYEFRSDGNPPTPPNIIVAYLPGDSAANVATAFRNAIDTFGTAFVTSSIISGDSVRLGQLDGHYGGRTGFTPATGGVGVFKSQTLPVVFSPTLIQTGWDPVDVLPGRQGPRPVILSTHAARLFIVT